MKFVSILPLLVCNFYANSQITRVWLTHQSEDPSQIVVNWHTQTPGNSEVIFYTEGMSPSRVTQNGHATLHHIEIPLAQQDVTYHYRVKTGNEESETFSFKGYPSSQKELRVAIVGNWGYADNPDLSQLISDDPHVLFTLGDNIPDLHQLCGEGVQDCIEPFLKLIDSQPALFQTTPFMPILGNHDKEVRPRGTQYPPVAVYDTNATAYRKFFELPGEEWKWKFSIGDFDATFIGLDLNHITDYGTTWQTCHAFGLNSDQFRWYSSTMEMPLRGHIITLQNEQNQRMRSQENGKWQQLFEKGTMVFAGYGYYLERAEVDGFPYFNTSLKAGDQYPDKFSKVLSPVGGYMLLTFTKNQPARVETKSLNGTLLDTYFSRMK